MAAKAAAPAPAPTPPPAAAGVAKKEEPKVAAAAAAVAKPGTPKAITPKANGVAGGQNGEQRTTLHAWVNT